ncbi:LacI family DNA-binding transcriptional regulator [Haloechinothrix sp. YIM 98757]|uniref:LacI family DNA-binding transcriptional regulator n=1 Tax=Haloechinothrix aidingensis TaxID=2752311 RepID=A0A838ACR0_9PSEU|nr:LacI family DNA-binding transcriptional regulator [Haloechinothrix aidingensis]MBA0127059.1 LacI family DNA-binding transcriptional regulator [Haloechinothrix aidingensis]
MNARHQRPTLEQVAERAGVGRGTVSRVINGSQQVSPAARESVLRAVEELGYVPNHAARTLVTRRTDTVALVISEPDERVFAEPFFSRVVRGASATLRQQGLQLLLSTAGSREEHARMAEYLTSHHVDGVMLISEHRDDTLPTQLDAAGVRYVHGGRPLGTGDEPVSYVDIDNIGGARAATRYLLGAGRRRVATITGPQDMMAGLDRRRGYEDALREAGGAPSPELTVPGDFSYDSGVRAMRQLTDTDPGIDAVFAASDLMALGAMRVLRESGKRVPEDVAVIGYDDSPASEHSEPPLTTVHQPAERMGAEMARVLADGIASGSQEPVSIVLDTHLVVRASA